MDSSQFAFLPRIGQGTDTALTYTVHHVLSYLDSPGAVRMLMLDYRKAFDSIPHQTILQSLIDKGAPKELLVWIISYLTCRKQRVKSNGSFSGWFEATSGVPQGGVLAPLLFAVAMDSLKVKCENSLIIKFADDITVLHFLRHAKEDNLQIELNNITKWSSEHGMQINFAKTKVINFVTKKCLAMGELRDLASSTIIEEVQSAKLLGVIFDCKLSWEQHLHYILSKAKRRIYYLHILRRISPNNHQLIRAVYLTMIRPILSYAYSSWCNISASRFNQLVRFEKRLFRMFLFSCEQISQFCRRSAEQLAIKAKERQHPLNIIYEAQDRRHSVRIGRPQRKLKSRTERFKNSFIQFA